MLEVYDRVIMPGALRKFWKHRAKGVRHQQTCPACGKTLVNTYRRDGVWKCKKCWDKEDASNA